MASRIMASRMMTNARLTINITGMRGFNTSLSLHGPRTRNLKEFSMAGKVAMVTGAARGLGRVPTFPVFTGSTNDDATGNTFCRAFIEAGCNSIAIVDLRKEDAQAAAEVLVADCVKDGIVKDGEVTALGFGCDVASEESVRITVKQIGSQLGLVDTLVTAAGIVENFPAIDYPTEKIRKLYDINVHGSFFCAREVAKPLLQRKAKGSIIFISSMSANIVNQPQLQTPYNASKAAVQHMASSLAVEWARSGIRVNAISPGYMITKLTAKILDENPELKESWHTMTPMGRMGQPEELKGAVVFLASDASIYVTGSEIRVDGGYCCV